MFSWVIFSHYFSDMFQFVYISQGAAPIHPPASSAATHHSCDNAEVRFFRECFHFSYFLFLKVVPAASPVKQSVAKKPANKRCSSKVDIIDYNFKWVLAASQNSHCKEGRFLPMPISMCTESCAIFATQDFHCCHIVFKEY